MGTVRILIYHFRDVIAFLRSIKLAGCLIYARALEYVNFLCGCVLLTRCYHPWNSRNMRCLLFLFSVENA